jgi:hypothetical protein
MARVAQGNIAVLFPAECRSAEEVPSDLMTAIEFANTCLSWQSNLTSEEIPPRWMWPFNDEMEEWFEEVDFQRKQKYGGGDSSGDQWAEDMDSNALLD